MKMNIMLVVNVSADTLKKIRVLHRTYFTGNHGLLVTVTNTLAKSEVAVAQSVTCTESKTYK